MPYIGEIDMNKRIKELVEQVNVQHKIGDNCRMVSDQELQEFAELIIKECMNICDEVQNQYGQYTFTATTVKDRIKQHFGIEE